MTSSPSGRESPMSQHYIEVDRQLVTQVSHPQQQMTTPRYHSSDARLPPDLLPYGQHNSTSIGGTKCKMFATTTDSNSLDRSLFIDNSLRSCDTGTDKMVICTTIGDNIATGRGSPFSGDRHYIRRQSDDEKDLRIYDTEDFLTTKSYGFTSTINARAPTATMGRNLTSANRNCNYEMTTTLNNSNSIGKMAQPFYNNSLLTSTTKVTVASHHQPMNATNSIEAGQSSANNCKPRQSIVRTSTSFSFLSSGYQQQDNFL